MQQKCFVSWYTTWNQLRTIRVIESCGENSPSVRVGEILIYKPPICELIYKALERHHIIETRRKQNKKNTQNL